MSIAAFLISPRELRGQIENMHDENILSKEIIETIVDNAADHLAWLGHDPADIYAEMDVLAKTLAWSSEYNRQNSEN